MNRALELSLKQNKDILKTLYNKWNEILSEVRQRQIYDITYMWNLKNDVNEPNKTEIDSQT